MTEIQEKKDKQQKQTDKMIPILELAEKDFKINTISMLEGKK